MLTGKIMEPVPGTTAAASDAPVADVKCGPLMGADVMPMAPLAGATSFSEVDAYQLAREVDDGVYELRRQFDDIVSNIWNAMDLTVEDKQAAIIAASRDLADRLSRVPTDAEAEAAAEGGKGMGLFDQIKTRLGMGAKAVWTTAYINNLPDSAFAYIEPGGTKEDGKTTPRSLRHFPHHNASGAIDMPHLRNAMSRMMQSPFGDNAKAHLTMHAKAEGVGAAAGKEHRGSAFVVTKDLSGNYRWLALNSNNFEDREGEVFSEAAHLDYVAWVDQTKEYPELRLWHVPHTRIGMADFAAYADHFMLTSGTFDPEFKDMAPVLAEREYGVSHGFTYRQGDKSADGTFHAYRTFEVSILPPEKAANTWTTFASIEALKEVAMTLPEDKKQFLLDHIGPERTARVEDAMETVGKELEGVGISFKDLDSAAATADAPAAAAEAAPPANAATPDPDPEPKPEGEGGGEGGEPAGAAPTAPAPSAMDEVLAGVRALQALPTDVTALKEQVEGLASRVATLEQTDDQKLESAVAPARADIPSQRPSTDSKTVIDEALAEKAIGKENTATGAPVNPVAPYIDQLFGSRAASG